MIQSLLRSMELLEVLKEKNRNFSIAELAEAMDLPPSTVGNIDRRGKTEKQDGGPTISRDAALPSTRSANTIQK